MDKKFLDVALEVKASDIKEDGTFKGHGSLFDKTPDSYGDIIARGAFSETLANGGRNKTGIAMLWQHYSDRIPGVWLSLAEDKKGLPVEGQLALKTTLGNDVYEIMKLGAELGTFKLGLSIGYDAKDFEYMIPKDGDRKIRILKKVELWEISLVTFPAKIGAMVSTVKTIEDAKTERELEKALREVGLSKSAAQYVVKLCRPSLREANTVVENGSLLTILDGLKQINQSLLQQKVVADTEDKGLSGILNSLKQINV